MYILFIPLLIWQSVILFMEWWFSFIIKWLEVPGDRSLLRVGVFGMYNGRPLGICPWKHFYIRYEELFSHFLLFLLLLLLNFKLFKGWWYFKRLFRVLLGFGRIYNDRTIKVVMRTLGNNDTVVSVMRGNMNGFH